MKNKCSCYHSAEKILYWAPDEAPITVKTGSCWGTKEREECSCGGDKTRCDFYPEIREKANKELEKVITNAGRIRTMTDDELAEFLLNCTNNDIGFCHVGMCLDRETCTEYALKWLRQPIKE